MFRGPLNMVFFATANNCDVQGDTARRILPSRLEHPRRTPRGQGGVQVPPARLGVREWRRLLAAALTILKGYVIAGMPDQQPSAWGSFAGWSQLVRSAVVWAGLEAP